MEKARGMWVVRIWVIVLVGVILLGFVLWGWLRPPQLKTVEVTKEVTKIVEKPVEKVVKETVVVEKVVTATPLPTPTGTATPASVAPMQGQVTVTATIPVTGGGSSPMATPTQVVTGAGAITAQGAWIISYFPGATQEIRRWKFQDPDPEIWELFPNVDNGVYKASDGVEYGMAESVFCQQGQRCDIIVAAHHYRLITGDYDTVLGKCSYGDGGAGCALLVVNIGSHTVVWRDQMVDAGFTVTGRYWNGGKLDQAIWALASHTAYNMLNLSGEKTNAGANCSSPSGCPKVKFTFVVVSGKEILMKGETLVSR